MNRSTATWTSSSGRLGAKAFGVLLIVCMGIACSTPKPPRRLVLQVTNQLGRDIAEIQKSKCGDSNSVVLEDSRIPAGQRRGFELPPTCVDLVAYDARGRIVGEQRNLKMLPGATWVLQR